MHHMCSENRGARIGAQEKIRSRRILWIPLDLVKCPRGCEFVTAFSRCFQLRAFVPCGVYKTQVDRAICCPVYYKLCSSSASEMFVADNFFARLFWADTELDTGVNGVYSMLAV